MLKRTLHSIELILTLGLAVTWAACGGGGSAAPSGGGGTPVAVEIPALSEVANLPFITGIVVSGSSDISAPLKSLGTSGLTKAVATTGNPFETGDSRVACETTNSWHTLLFSSIFTDAPLCVLQGAASAATAASVDIYDGSYHVFSASGASSGFPNKYKAKIKRNSNKVITDYEMFACADSTQVGYTSYSISGSDITVSSQAAQALVEPNNATISQTGKLSSSDPTQYTAKSITYSYTGTNSAGAYEGIVDSTQSTGAQLFDAFDSRGGGGTVTRVYSKADLTNPSGTPFDPRKYELGSGAGNLIVDSTSLTECWDGTSLMPVTCLDSNANYTAIKDKTPKKASTVTISAFSGTTKWDCAGSAEFSTTLSTGSDSCLTRFAINYSHIDCLTATDGGFLVTAKVGGSVLSTSSGSPTSVSTSLTLVLTTNRVANADSFTSDTVTLKNTADDSSVTLTNLLTGWNSAFTELTTTATLTSGQSYKLTIKSGTSGVKSTKGDTKTMSADKVYYMTAQ